MTTARSVGTAAAGQPSLPGPLFEALLDCAARRVSGVLRVTGDPGGAVHLAEGGVTAIETPGAPGPEVLLLRSGRIPEPGWAAADRVDIDPDNLAALAAASQGLAARMAAEAGKGALREALTRGSGGCVAVYPVGMVALLAVVGDEGLDTSRLHRESRVTVPKLEGLLGGSGPGQAHAAAS